MHLTSPFNAQLYRDQLSAKVSQQQQQSPLQTTAFFQTLIQQLQQVAAVQQHQQQPPNTSVKTEDVSAYHARIAELEATTKKLQSENELLRQQSTAALGETANFTTYNATGADHDHSNPIQIVLNITTPSSDPFTMASPSDSLDVTGRPSVAYRATIAGLEADLERSATAAEAQQKKQMKAVMEAAEFDNAHRLQKEQQMSELQKQLQAANQMINTLKVQLEESATKATGSTNADSDEDEITFSNSATAIGDSHNDALQQFDSMLNNVRQSVIAATPGKVLYKQPALPTTGKSIRYNIRAAGAATPLRTPTTSSKLSAMMSSPAAVASATKIQSAFRGHLTRSALELEKQLAALPIHSPSTPAQTSAKRVRANPTASAIAKPKFTLNTESETTSAASSVAPTPVATPAIKKATPATMRTMTVKQVANELKSLKKTLRDTSNDWTLRQQALNRIEELARTIIVQSSADVDAWEAELKSLQPALIEQIIDLRLSIVREACRTLIALSEAHVVAFEASANVYLPHLFKNLYVTIKVISGSCDECCRTLVRTVNSPKLIPTLLAGANDTHKEVREGAGRYLAQLMTQIGVEGITEGDLSPTASQSVINARRAGLTEQIDGVSEVVRKYIGDGDKDVRAAFRLVFESLFTSTSYRAAADQLFASFSAAVQKTIESERRQRAQQRQQSKRKK